MRGYGKRTGKSLHCLVNGEGRTRRALALGCRHPLGVTRLLDVELHGGRAGMARGLLAVPERKKRRIRKRGLAGRRRRRRRRRMTRQRSQSAGLKRLPEPGPLWYRRRAMLVPLLMLIWMSMPLKLELILILALTLMLTLVLVDGGCRYLPTTTRWLCLGQLGIGGRCI